MTEYIHYKNFEKTVLTAVAYGFTPLKAPTITKEDLSEAKQFDKSSDDALCDAEEKIAVLRAFTDKTITNLPLPLMAYYEGYCPGSTAKKDSHIKRCSIDIVGSSKSISDAILIALTHATLLEEGVKDISLKINSVGDRESYARFTREFINYYKKNLHLLSPACRQVFKKDPFALLECSHDKCKSTHENAPVPMNFLSEASRIHFRELLEHLETISIPYEIDSSLLPPHEFCSHTLFEFYGCTKKGEDKTLLASGFRYNTLSKKIGKKKDFPAAGVTICLNKNGGKSATAPKMKKPCFYFIQIGPEARLKSLKLIESLRKEDIVIHHSLLRDKLGNQLMQADYLKVPYVIIMGQKESLDNTVLVRNVTNHSQDVIKLDKLAEHLKHIAQKQ